MLFKNSLAGVAGGVLFLISLTIVLFSFSIPLQTADFFVPASEDEQVININEPTDNAYVAGEVVNVNALVQKDLIVAGNNININESVYRSVFVAGNTINFNLDETMMIQGSVRAVGGEIVISGNFVEDILVAGSIVRFENAKVLGDVYISADTLEINNSLIAGDFFGSVNKYDKDLIDNQVEGSLFMHEGGVGIKEEAGAEIVALFVTLFAFVGFLWMIIQEISYFFGFLLILLVLKKYNKLEIKTLRLDSSFTKDFIVGLLVVVLPILFILLSFLVFPLVFLPLFVTLFLLFCSIFVLSQSFLPIYIANLIKNTYNINFGIGGGLIMVFYVIIVTFNLLNFFFPVNPAGFLFFIIWIVLSVFGSASYGFVLRQIVVSFKKSLETKN